MQGTYEQKYVMTKGNKVEQGSFYYKTSYLYPCEWMNEDDVCPNPAAYLVLEHDTDTGKTYSYKYCARCTRINLYYTQKIRNADGTVVASQDQKMPISVADTGSWQDCEAID